MKKRILTVVGVLALAAVLVVSLVACIPSDPAKAEENLKAEGYDVLVVNSDDALGIVGLALPDGCVTQVTGSKALSGDLGDNITIYYFEDSDAATAYMDKNADWQGEIDVEIAELEEAYKAGEISENDFNSMKDLLESVQMKKQGKIVYVGSADAIKAAK